MLSQAFTVIADDYDYRIPVAARLLQIRDELAKCRVSIGDLSVIQTIFVRLRIRGWGFVGIVRIIEMNPHTMWACGMPGEPRFRMLDDFRTAALDAPPAFFSPRMLGEIVVEIKPAVEARSESFAVENNCADKIRRAIGIPLEQLGYGWMSRGKR